MTYAEIESYLDHGLLLDPSNIKLTKITMKNGETLEAYFYKMNQSKKLRPENKWTFNIRGKYVTLNGDDILSLKHI